MFYPSAKSTTNSHLELSKKRDSSMLMKGTDQLEWSAMVEYISGGCTTVPGDLKVKGVTPSLSTPEIIERWRILSPITELIDSGYCPRIGSIDDLGTIFRSLSLGSVLDGESLRLMLTLLDSTVQVHNFCEDFKGKCPVLGEFSIRLFPLPRITSLIERSIDEDGEIKDDASDSLQKIRNQKRHLSTKIQNKIKSLLHDTEIEMYLQDSFFTIRNDRYVIPMRLDGHGRIKGNVIDTSNSGQTMFLEPFQITELNQTLLDLESEEKVEIAKILKNISVNISKHLSEISESYETLIELDFFVAQAKFFSKFQCNAPSLASEPTISLKSCFHPLLKISEDSVVENDIELKSGQSCLVISGPNAGGKTVVLKTLAYCHLMAKCGFLLPCSKDSTVFLFNNIHLELGDGQSVTQSLSTFSAHLLGLRPIVESSSSHDLVLLDEIAVGTEPNVGSAIAQAVLEELTRKKVITVVTTHFEKLKILAIENPSMRNASMEYLTESFSPSFRLILDVPGKSFALELAAKIGIPDTIIDRAKELSGQNLSDLDMVIAEVMQIKQAAFSEAEKLKAEKLEAAKQKNRWNHEIELLQQTRKKAAEKLKIRFEEQINEKIDEVELAKKELKNTKTLSPNAEQKAKSNVGKKLDSLKKEIGELEKFTPNERILPGSELTWDDAKSGEKVFVIPLNKSGNILKTAKDKDVIEVQVGLLKIRSQIAELRLLKDHIKNQSSSSEQAKKPLNLQKPKFHTLLDQTPEISYSVQTSSNTVNLRGLDVTDGIEKAMSFIDSGLLKGESCVFLLHGHGTSALKNAIRQKLATDCPYRVTFRPGDRDEGGDGVTVVMFS